MFFNLPPASNNDIPRPITPSEKSFCISEQASKIVKTVCYQYVNPSLLFEWEGQMKKANQISGSGVFRAYERSKDGNHKSKLILSLEADKWRDGKPNGDVKLMQVFFFDSNRKDNIIKQVRKFTGRMENMMKEGYGEYTIEHFYSNQTKSITEIKGNWRKDQLTEAAVFQDGIERQNIRFSHNVQIPSSLQNEIKPMPSIKTLQPMDKKIGSRVVLNPIGSNKCTILEIDRRQDQNQEKPMSSKNLGNNLLTPSNGKQKINQKSIR